MTAHSSILAWRIAWEEEPGGVVILGMTEHVCTHTDPRGSTLVLS